MTTLTWTGTKASARKLEDDINDVDVIRSSLRNFTYATVEVEFPDEFEVGARPQPIAYVDTLSSAVTMRPGQSITNESGKWELVAEETETA